MILAAGLAGGCLKTFTIQEPTSAVIAGAASQGSLVAARQTALTGRPERAEFAMIVPKLW
jgi:hypothetical protein